MGNTSTAKAHSADITQCGVEEFEATDPCRGQAALLGVAVPMRLLTIPLAPKKWIQKLGYEQDKAEDWSNWFGSLTVAVEVDWFLNIYDRAHEGRGPFLTRPCL